MQYQVMKRSATTHDVYQIDPIRTPSLASANVYEIVGRVVLDLQADRFFVERPRWTDKGFEWHRVDRPYVVFQAAFNAVVTPVLVD